MNGVLRRVQIIALAFMLFCCLSMTACVKTDDFNVYEGFSVNFLDVGEGDAIFINFGDGKTMLIDCGEKSNKNFKILSQYLNVYAKDGLDYLVLTHPDGDHVGNAAAVLDNYAVKTAYIPNMVEPENFGEYYNAYLKIKDKNIGRISETGKVISGEDYYAVFLSPNAKGTTDSAYTAINSTPNPSEQEINNLSPIIYLEYKGVKFVFTGDAGFTQEKVALDNVQTGIIKRYLKHDINLSDVDFLKVSHHGAEDGSGEKFLKALTPKNAVISVGGGNIHGHPNTETLSRIVEVSPDCKIYTTSEYGTLSVLVDENGEITLKSAA